MLLFYRYACTGHKTQGKTYEKIAVRLGSKMPFAGHDYLIFSRVRDLYSIIILDEVIYNDRFVRYTDQDLKFFEMNAREEDRLDILAAARNY